MRINHPNRKIYAYDFSGCLYYAHSFWSLVNVLTDETKKDHRWSYVLDRDKTTIGMLGNKIQLYTRWSDPYLGTIVSSKGIIPDTFNQDFFYEIE
jgi:hypothetical protein